MVHALEALHGCSCSIELMPIGSAESCGLEIVVISTWPSTEIGKRQPTLITKHGFLALDREDGVARIYGALHEHDALISRRVYKQGDMFRA